MLTGQQLARRLHQSVEEDARARVGAPRHGPVMAAAPPPPLRRRAAAAAHPASLCPGPPQALDAAKKEAVVRRADYDTFKALVSAAHLRPMRGGLQLGSGGTGGKPPAQRTFRPDGSIAPPLSGITTASSAAEGSSKVLDDVLRSGSAFVRAWRAAPAAADRQELLQRAHSAGALARLLRLELSSRLLEEALACLEADPAAAASAAADADPGAAPHLAAAVVAAAAASSSYAVARAGLSLQGRHRLASLEGALEAAH